MTDRMMSRRRLIGAAAGALLLSGCSVQEDSSTKKVKKQGKINKAEASDQSKHLRDKDELYEVYDDSGIVTMYLTVSRGNSSENTDHSWADINTYSVYDLYAKELQGGAQKGQGYLASAAFHCAQQAYG